ncbi:hypothetical protein B0H14DRAFT_3463090 [Mycena olivaceomarginata]|nr:hypothetical protein B0H14DRAFT_3463090 [Mycena olivaceomarginata]
MCSPNTKGVWMQLQLDDSSVWMGSGLNKDDVQLGSRLNKADSQVALDTNKDTGDQARLFPKWTCDAGLGAGAGWATPNKGSMWMGFDVDKDNVQMGFSLDKDDVRLGSRLDKADPWVALDTNKYAGDQARLFPSWRNWWGVGAWVHAISCYDAPDIDGGALGDGIEGARAKRAVGSSTSTSTSTSLASPRFEGVGYEKLQHGSEREEDSGERKELHCAFDLKF